MTAESPTSPIPTAPRPCTSTTTMGYRVYWPLHARFLTRDPLGYSAGPNLYTYASGDPVNRIDPDGLDDRTWWQKGLDTVGNVASAPFRWLWNGIKAGTAVKMREDAPTLQRAYIDPDCPEFGLRFRRAGIAVSNYIDETATGALMSVAGSLGST